MFSTGPVWLIIIVIFDAVPVTLLCLFVRLSQDLSALTGTIFDIEGEFPNILLVLGVL